MLQFDPTWWYESPGPLSPPVADAFFEVICKIAAGSQSVLEHFKTHFGAAAGTVAASSSNASWALTDLQQFFDAAATNAPLCINAFYTACHELPDGPVPAPGAKVINRLLTKHGERYCIEPPNLFRIDSEPAVAQPEVPASLAQQAKALVEQSFADSQQMLAKGQFRPAVQDVLWLLETVATAFQGRSVGDANAIEGKYFNTIVSELRKQRPGTPLEQILGWLKTLHGYLSAPAGGGIRHGMHLKDGVATNEGEARLYCNLITSYTAFLLTEYDRLIADPSQGA